MAEAIKSFMKNTTKWGRVTKVTVVGVGHTVRTLSGSTYTVVPGQTTRYAAVRVPHWDEVAAEEFTDVVIAEFDDLGEPYEVLIGFLAEEHQGAPVYVDRLTTSRIVETVRDCSLVTV